MCKTYEEYENKCGISCSSLESYYAESAWNHALKEVRRLVNECAKSNHSVGELVARLQEEINTIDTDFYDM